MKKMSNEIVAIVEKDKHTNEISVLEYVQGMTEDEKNKIFMRYFEKGCTVYPATQSQLDEAL